MAESRAQIPRGPELSPLRILLLCYEYPPLGGGGGIGAKKYAEAWVGAGHDVTVVTGGGEDLPTQDVVAGVHVHRVPTFRKKTRATATMAVMASYLITGASFVIANRKWLRDYDVINTHFSVPTGPLGWLAARILRKPNVLTIIGGDIYDPTKRSSPHRSSILKRVNRFLINRADSVVAISSDTKRRARDLYGIERPIKVINYGFEPHSPAVSSEKAARREGDPFRLIAVGRLVRRKGFDHLIDAVALLRNVRLRIVGDGPDDEILRARARERGVDDRVEFAGYLSNEEVDEALRASDCFVLSSIHEGLGIVVQEAMFAGLPIVSTDNGGQVDLVKPGRNGLLVPIGDSRALAEAIDEIRNDAALAARMGKRNREDLRRLDMAENSQLYVLLFRDCLMESARPRR